jgi:hypothetical protein
MQTPDVHSQRHDSGETEKIMRNRSLYGVHLTHIKPNILRLNTLTIWPSPAPTNETPDTNRSNSPCEYDERDHKRTASNFDGALLGVVFLDHACAAHVLQFARPCLQVKCADVVAEKVVAGVAIVHARGDEINISITEMRCRAVCDGNGDEGEEHENTVCNVEKHNIAAESPRLCL